MPPDLIIFDFDGVIADSEVLSNRIFAEQLTAAGMPTTLDEAIERYSGRRWRDCVPLIEALHGRAVDPDLDARWAAAMHASAPTLLQPVAGVADFLDTLGDHPRCIASSSYPDWLSACLRQFGLDHHFGDRLFSGAVHVTRGKPHPDIYLHAAHACGTPPSHCLAIEDSPTGVAAAVAAGIDVVGLCAASHVRAGHAERLRAAGATHIADSYDAVKALIGLR